MADDLFDFLADPSDSARGRRLADALRRQRGQADLLQATGDKQLGGLAAQQYRAADEGEQSMRQAVSGHLTRSAELERAKAAQAAALEREQAQLAERERVATAGMPLKKLQVDAQLGRIDAENRRTDATGALSQVRLKQAMAKLGRVGRAGASAVGPDGKPVPEELGADGLPLPRSRLELQNRKFEMGLAPHAAWLEMHPEDEGKSYRDPEAGKEFGKALTLNLQSHDHIKTMTGLYRAMRSAATRGDEQEAAQHRADFNLQLEALIPKITGAEGMTATVDALSNIKHSLEANDWISNLAKAANSEFVPNLLKSSGETIDKNLVNASRVALERRGKNKKAALVQPDPGGAVQMRFPDGSVHPVTPDKLEKAKAKGGVPVNG